MGVDCLVTIPLPERSSIIFVSGYLTPWEAYLARYDTIPLVVIIGEEALDSKHHGPRPTALEGDPKWKVVLKAQANVWNVSKVLDVVVYERVGSKL